MESSGREAAPPGGSGSAATVNAPAARFGVASATHEPNPFAALDGYDMRYLVPHLIASQRLDDLHAVLTLDHSGTNAWHEAKRSASDLVGYFSDLDQAGTAATAAGQLTRRIGYAVMRASTRASSSSLPTALQRKLVDTGAWGPSEVVGTVTAQVSLLAKTQALVYLEAGLNNAPEREQLHALIVEEARQASDPATAALALCQLAVMTDEAARAHLAELALNNAERLPPGQDRYGALTILAGKQLDAPLTIISRAIAGILELLSARTEDSQARSLAAFVPQMAPSGRSLIVSHLARFTNATARALVLEPLLVAGPTSDVLAAAQDCLGELDDPGAQIDLVAAIAARMPQAGAQRLLEIAWPKVRDELTTASVPNLIRAIAAAQGDLRDNMLAVTLDLADHAEDGIQRLSLYAAIAEEADETTKLQINDRIVEELLVDNPRFRDVTPLGDPANRIAGVLRLAEVDPDAYAWCVNLALDWCEQAGVQPVDFGELALPHLAPLARGNDVARVLDLALSMRNGINKGRVLGAIAPHLTPAQHQVAVRGASEIDEPQSRDEALAVLARAVPDELFAETALETVAAIASPYKRREVINEIVQRADPDSLPAWVGLASRGDDSEGIARLKLSLLGRYREDARDALLDAVLADARRHAKVDPEVRTWLAVEGVGAEGTRQWRESNQIGRAAARAEQQKWWLAALTAPHPEVSAEQRRKILTVARELVAEVHDQAERALVQAHIAVATGDRRLLDKALETARSCEPPAAAVTLAKIAAHLSGPEADTVTRNAIELADSLLADGPDTHSHETSDEEGRDVTAVRVLVACIRHLPPGTVDSAVERAQMVQDWGVRTELLAALSRTAEPALAAQLHYQAEGNIGLISGWIDQLEADGVMPFMQVQEINKTKSQLLVALGAVASSSPVYDDELMQRLLATANEESSAFAAGVLDGLPARCRDQTRIQTALALVRGLDNPIVRRRAVGYFQPGSATDPSGIAPALDLLASRNRGELLRDLGCLCPLLASPYTADDAEELVKTLDSVAQWWP